MISLKDINIDAISLGDTDVDKVSIGEELLWEKPIQLDSIIIDTQTMD